MKPQEINMCYSTTLSSPPIIFNAFFIKVVFQPHHIVTIIELSFDSTKVMVRSWLFRMQYFARLVSFQFMLGVGVEV